jgi:hypothetical protein
MQHFRSIYFYFFRQAEKFRGKIPLGGKLFLIGFLIGILKFRRAEKSTEIFHPAEFMSIYMF